MLLLFTAVLAHAAGNATGEGKIEKGEKELTAVAAAAASVIVAGNTFSGAIFLGWSYIYLIELLCLVLLQTNLLSTTHVWEETAAAPVIVFITTAAGAATVDDDVVVIILFTLAGAIVQNLVYNCCFACYYYSCCW